MIHLAESENDLPHARGEPDDVSEADWEAIAPEQFAHHDWTPTPGTAIAPGVENGRATWADLFCPARLTAAVHRLNPHVRQRAFSQCLDELMNRYTNAQLTAAEMIAMARDVRAESARGAGFDPPMNHDEPAFNDAVAANSSAVDVTGTDVLAEIARKLAAVMRRDVKTDWTVCDDVRAKLRSSIKRLLISYKYPPDQQPEAIRLVMEQTETMATRHAA